jgi:hypothetical protein
MQYNIVLKIGNQLYLLQVMDNDYERTKEAIRKAQDTEELWDLLNEIDYTLTDYIEIIEF